LTDQFGSSILSKALSADQASAVIAGGQLANDMKSVHDIEAMKDDLISNGASPDKLSELNSSESQVISQVKRLLTSFSTNAINDSVAETCKVHKTLIEDEETNTSVWLIRNKVAIDILLTIEIEEWVNKALKANVINHTAYNAKKSDIANY